MNEAVKEMGSLSDAFESALRSEVPEMKFEIVKQGDKTVFVCDYTPKTLPWDPHEEVKDADTQLFKKFYGAYNRMRQNGDYKGVNISSKGWTDLRDVRCLLGDRMKNRIWIMPKSQWQSLGGKPFVMKNEKIIDLCVKRSKQNSVVDWQSTNALIGDKYAQLPAVLSGVKPLAVEIKFHNNAFLRSIIETAPNLRGVVLNISHGGRHEGSHGSYDSGHGGSVGHHGDPHGDGSDEEKSEEVLYNPVAVERVIMENELLFKELGMESKSVEEVVIFISSWHFGSSKTPPELNDKMRQALGLLLGFDRISCEPEKYHERGKSQFIAPDHDQAHPFNEIPFNFFDVDYKIYDSKQNIAFQELRRQYDQVVVQIEQNLKQGMSPRDALLSLNGSNNSDSRTTNKITYNFKPNELGELDGVRGFPRDFDFYVEAGSASEEERRQIINIYEDVIIEKVMKSNALWEDMSRQVVHSPDGAFSKEEFEVDGFLVEIDMYVDHGRVRIRVNMANKSWKKKRQEEIERVFGTGSDRKSKRLMDLSQVTTDSAGDELAIVDPNFDPTKIFDRGDRPVDASIMELVRILNMVGIETTNSCGGHIEREGHEKDRGHGVSEAGEIHLPYMNIAWNSFSKFAKALVRFGEKSKQIECKVLGLNNVFCSFPKGTPLKEAQEVFEEFTDFLAKEIHGEHEKGLTPSETLHSMKRKVKKALGETKG
ncbi:MAG: hypothetical protein NTX63_03650 [Candidatus Peregrinibacteria bacterium]|nr:hypothetical protein [Candidatus Peregrinibacteria bacterium]